MSKLSNTVLKRMDKYSKWEKYSWYFLSTFLFLSSLYEEYFNQKGFLIFASLFVLSIFYAHRKEMIKKRRLAFANNLSNIPSDVHFILKKWNKLIWIQMIIIIGFNISSLFSSYLSFLFSGFWYLISFYLETKIDGLKKELLGLFSTK